MGAGMFDSDGPTIDDEATGVRDAEASFFFGLSCN
jgi:hypothetical protein